MVLQGLQAVQLKRPDAETDELPGSELDPSKELGVDGAVMVEVEGERDC